MTTKKFTDIPTYHPDDKNFKLVPEELGGEVVEVIYRRGNPGKSRKQIEEIRAKGEYVSIFNFCAPLNPHTYEAVPGITCEQDVCIALRDGVKIYADIYRPKDISAPVPLIIAWSPFGKRQSEGMGEWKLMGVPPQTVSPMAKFEAADPGYWCHYGYAVANVDPRGVGNSEGDVSNFGLQDGRDGYDFIEWAAKQDWCSGKISMFGNSGVGMVIWRIAAEVPPHLACIAVWEGTGDMYRESFCLGGIDSPKFNEGIMDGVACKEYIEDGPNMLATHHFMDKYWESKIPRWENIKVPAYVCAGFCHFHLRGSFEGFRRIRSPKKWMRAHREMEWPDTYHRDNLDDLRKFYDRFLKDIHNGWELTPRVRMNLMDAYSYDFNRNREEKEFPLARTEYRKLYLDASTHTSSYKQVEKTSEASYDPKTEVTTFDFKVPEDTEIIGYMKLRLFVECRGHDNMDLFIWVKKLDQNGEYLPLHCMDENYRGAWGYFRAKRRELDPKWSSDFQPVQAHRKDEPMEQGKIYPVDIEIVPTARIWHKGESIRLEIAGRFIKTEWYEDQRFIFELDNGEGTHVIHTGGKYESFLQIPYIPPRFRSGEYIYR
jgi:predicted acyl esterase